MTIKYNIAHATAITGGALLFCLSRPGSSLFSYHPAMMSAGLQIFIMEGVLFFTDKRVHNKIKMKIHLSLSCIGVLCIFLGFQAIYRVKEAHNQPHYSSWHGRFGLITVTALAFQLLGGVPTLYAWEVMKFTGIPKRIIKEAHGLSSLSCGGLMIISILTGFYTKWFVMNVDGALWWFILILTLTPRAIFAYEMKMVREKKERNRQKNGD